MQTITETKIKIAEQITAGELTIDQAAALTGWPVRYGCLIPEPRKWHANDGGDAVAYECDSAHDAAQKYVDDGSYDTEAETTWINVTVWREGIDSDGDDVLVEQETVKIALDPDEPACIDGEEHDWQSPHSIVGGIKENPGVWGHGGGITIQAACLRCGCGRLTDTWAQDPEDGRQGLRSVSYEPRKYAAEVEAMTEDNDDAK